MLAEKILAHRKISTTFRKLRPVRGFSATFLKISASLYGKVSLILVFLAGVPEDVVGSDNFSLRHDVVEVVEGLDLLGHDDDAVLLLAEDVPEELRDDKLPCQELLFSKRGVRVGLFVKTKFKGHSSG